MEKIIALMEEILVAAGGFGFAGWILFKFLGQKAVDLFMKKYESSQEERIERLKNNLEKGRYMTQKRYDKIFEIYENLTSSFWGTVDHLQKMIPKDGRIDYPSGIAERARFIEDSYEGLKRSYVEAKRMLFRYIPFFQVEHFEEGRELLDLIKIQLLAFQNVRESGMTTDLTEEDYQRTKDIEDKYVALCKEIREYLFSLQFAGEKN